MTHIRLRYEIEGRHVHCRMFTAPATDRTFAMNGCISFDQQEWPDVRERLLNAGIELIEDKKK